jgi:hypothetical protein
MSTTPESPPANDPVTCPRCLLAFRPEASPTAPGGPPLPEQGGDLETVYLRRLEKEPERRYPDCQALADDLRRWGEGEPVSAQRPGVGERLARWARWNPAVAALSAAAVLLLVAGSVVAASFAVRARENEKRANEKADEAFREAERAEREEQKAKELARREKEQRHKADVARHGFQMTAAWQAWRHHDVATAEALLDDVRPALQSTWEYRRLRSLCRCKALTLKGHAGVVSGVAFSPDGKRIVSRGQFGKVLVWDAASGRRLADATDAPPAGAPTVAVSGNLRVRADGVLLRLERIPLREDTAGRRTPRRLRHGSE